MSTPTPTSEQHIDRLTETLQRERLAHVRTALARELAYRGTAEDRAAQLAAKAVAATPPRFLDTGEAEFRLADGRLLRGHAAVRELATDLRVRETDADATARLQKAIEQKRRAGVYSGF